MGEVSGVGTHPPAGISYIAGRATPRSRSSRSAGTVTYGSHGSTISGTPLLGADDRRFFGERCYLQQSTLGRLLELYETSSGGSDSPLTVFVKDLLGLDELDALIDGLYPVTDKRRVKRLVPEYGELDDDVQARRQRLRMRQQELTAVAAGSAAARGRLGELLAALDAPPALEGDLERTQSWLAQGAAKEEHALTELVGARRELAALTTRADGLATRSRGGGRSDRSPGLGGARRGGRVAQLVWRRA